MTEIFQEDLTPISHRLSPRDIIEPHKQNKKNETTNMEQFLPSLSDADIHYGLSLFRLHPDGHKLFTKQHGEKGS